MASGADDWENWFAAAGLEPRPITGPVFDSSRLMVEAAMQGAGVALAPARMFERELRTGRLAHPFAVQVDTGRYWLTWLRSKRMTPAMQSFSDWILAQAAQA